MVEADELSDRVAFINDGHLLAVDRPEQLKLAHGQRSVRIRRRGAGGAVTDDVVALDTADTGERVRAAMSAGEVLTIHTEEATLEDVFVAFAGRGLAS
jgi:ABC-2 type transport system ATP-binding protein